MIKHRLASGADVRQEIERVAEAEFETALENDVTSSLVVHYAKARRGGSWKMHGQLHLNSSETRHIYLVGVSAVENAIS